MKTRLECPYCEHLFEDEVDIGFADFEIFEELTSESQDQDFTCPECHKEFGASIEVSLDIWVEEFQYDDGNDESEEGKKEQGK